MFLRRLILLLCLGCTLRANAEDLRQIYELAVANDAVLQAAFAHMVANDQALPKALAQMAPNLSANYTTTGSESNLSFLGEYNTKNYGLTLAQPIFYPAQWAQLEQSRHIVKGSTATYLSVAQDLITRVANQYFAVLAANDDLLFTKAQLKSFGRELEQSQQRFEVGLIAITDVQDSKARYDTAVAEEIAAENKLFDEYENLRVIIGQPARSLTLFPTSKELPLLPPSPNRQEVWVDSANKYNWSIIAAKENSEQQKAAIGIQAAGHFPTVNLEGNLTRNKGVPPIPFDELSFTRSLSLNVSVPIFASGGVLFRTREARALYEEAMKQLEEEQRTVDSDTRQAYRGVLTAISSVTALTQVVASNRTALEATKAAYEVGTRTIVDVLNAETNLNSAIRDQAKARYQYLLEGLKLKQAAGILTAADLFAVNELIVKNPPPASAKKEGEKEPETLNKNPEKDKKPEPVNQDPEKDKKPDPANLEKDKKPDPAKQTKAGSAIKKAEKAKKTMTIAKRKVQKSKKLQSKKRRKISA
ncbi:MAG: TolC family outer membrane protein [Candidatus Berkiellales bacterium]